MSKTQANLTEGPILKVLTKLALPIMASAFLGTDDFKYSERVRAKWRIL